MLLAFIFALISAEWPDQGSYSFFCVFLVLGVFISGYFLITLIGGYRGEFFCGKLIVILCVSHNKKSFKG